MENSDGSHATLWTLLEALLEAEWDIVETLSGAMTSLTTPMIGRQVETFASDHRRQAEELGRRIRELGREPPPHEDPAAHRTRTFFLGRFNGDQLLLGVIRASLEQLGGAYERSLAREDLPIALREVLEFGRSEARRHRYWVDVRLAHFTAVRDGDA